MLWSIKTRNSQIINFNHEQLMNNIQKQCPKTSSQSINNKKVENKKSFEQLFQSLQNYQMISKYVDSKILKLSPNVHLKKYRQCVYWGELIQNRKQGKGLMLYLNCRVYEGEWRDNFKQGKGYQKFSNGSVYYGSYLKGKPHGYGKYEWQNGQIFQGQWINGLKNGSGIWRGSNGDSYIGEWKDGKVHGYGVHTWINGNRYEGQFQQCLKHGQGIQKFNNGDSYKGSYQNGKPHGYGEYLWNDGSSYQGNFNQGLRNGNGIWRKTQSINSDTYEGEFVDQNKQGYGIFTWLNGSKYKGNFKNDKRHGYGEMYWIDGNIYKGEWDNGHQTSQNIYCPEQKQFAQYEGNHPMHQVLEKYNPEKIGQFQEFDEPIHPEIVELKKYRARDLLRTRRSRNEAKSNVIEDLPGGFLMSRNFMTEAVMGNNKALNLMKRPSRLSVKAGEYAINMNEKPKIKHCHSSSSKKNMSPSICNYLYVNKPFTTKSNSRPQMGIDSRFQLSNNNNCNRNSRSRSDFAPRHRMIKSSAGIRNVNKNMNQFREQISMNRMQQNENEMKFFSRSKNKSQIF